MASSSRPSTIVRESKLPLASSTPETPPPSDPKLAEGESFENLKKLACFSSHDDIRLLLALLDPNEFIIYDQHPNIPWFTIQFGYHPDTRESLSLYILKPGDAHFIKLTKMMKNKDFLDTSSQRLYLTVDFSQEPGKVLEEILGKIRTKFTDALPYSIEAERVTKEFIKAQPYFYPNANPQKIDFGIFPFSDNWSEVIRRTKDEYVHEFLPLHNSLTEQLEHFDELNSAQQKHVVACGLDQLRKRDFLKVLMGTPDKEYKAEKDHKEKQTEVKPLGSSTSSSSSSSSADLVRQLQKAGDAKRTEPTTESSKWTSPSTESTRTGPAESTRTRPTESTRTGSIESTRTAPTERTKRTQSSTEIEKTSLPDPKTLKGDTPPTLSREKAEVPRTDEVKKPQAPFIFRAPVSQAARPVFQSPTAHMVRPSVEVPKSHVSPGAVEVARTLASIPAFGIVRTDISTPTFETPRVEEHTPEISKKSLDKESKEPLREGYSHPLFNEESLAGMDNSGPVPMEAESISPVMYGSPPSFEPRGEEPQPMEAKRIYPVRTGSAPSYLGRTEGSSVGLPRSFTSSASNLTDLLRNLSIQEQADLASKHSLAAFTTSTGKSAPLVGGLIPEDKIESKNVGKDKDLKSEESSNEKTDPKPQVDSVSRSSLDIDIFEQIRRLSCFNPSSESYQFDPICFPPVSQSGHRKWTPRPSANVQFVIQESASKPHWFEVVVSGVDKVYYLPKFLEFKPSYLDELAPGPMNTAVYSIRGMSKGEILSELKKHIAKDVGLSSSKKVKAFDLAALEAGMDKVKPGMGLKK